MQWQYRVMRSRWQLGHKWAHHYAIYEVYSEMIDTKGKNWTTDAMEPSGDTLAELKSDYEYMAEAFKLPVLDHKTGKPIKAKKEKK